LVEGRFPRSYPDWWSTDCAGIHPPRPPVFSAAARRTVDIDAQTGGRVPRKRLLVYLENRLPEGADGGGVTRGGSQPAIANYAYFEQPRHQRRLKDNRERLGAPSRRFKKCGDALGLVHAAAPPAAAPGLPSVQDPGCFPAAIDPWACLRNCVAPFAGLAREPVE